MILSAAFMCYLHEVHKIKAVSVRPSVLPLVSSLKELRLHLLQLVLGFTLKLFEFNFDPY
jgi:hypothetical protein